MGCGGDPVSTPNASEFPVTQLDGIRCQGFNSQTLTLGISISVSTDRRIMCNFVFKVKIEWKAPFTMRSTDAC